MNPLKACIDLLEGQELWEKETVLKRGQLVVRAGDRNDDVFFVHSGCIRVFVNLEGEEHTIRFGYSGAMLSALDTYITGNPCNYNFEAIRKTTIKSLAKSTFIKLLSQHAELQKFWSQMLEVLVFQQLEREKDLLITSPQTRVKRVMQRSPKLFQEVPAKYIADYLRMTPETLSRIQNLDRNQD